MAEGVSDLVQRLRDRAYSGKGVDTLCEDAAAEIDRLRDLHSDVDRLLGRIDCSQRRGIFEQEAEIARLRNGTAAGCETDHDAAPAATARTDAAGISRQGTGNTPVTEPMPKEKRAEVYDTPLAAGGRAACGRAEAATPDSPSLSGAPVTDGRPAPTAEPVAWGVASRSGLLCTSICRGDASEMQCEFECDTDVVPLYRHPSPCPYVVGTVTRYCALTTLTLTDAERSAIADAADRYAEITPESRETAATLRGLLARLA